MPNVIIILLSVHFRRSGHRHFLNIIYINIRRIVLVTETRVCYELFSWTAHKTQTSPARIGAQTWWKKTFIPNDRTPTTDVCSARGIAVDFAIETVIIRGENTALKIPALVLEYSVFRIVHTTMAEETRAIGKCLRIQEDKQTFYRETLQNKYCKYKATSLGVRINYFSNVRILFNSLVVRLSRVSRNNRKFASGMDNIRSY